MFDKIKQLRIETERLVQKWDEIDYEALINLVDQRDVLLEQLKANWDESHPRLNEMKNEIQLLTRYDAQILAKMQSFQAEAAQGMKHLQALKVQKNAYEPEHRIESLFFDEKK